MSVWFERDEMHWWKKKRLIFWEIVAYIIISNNGILYFSRIKMVFRKRLKKINYSFLMFEFESFSFIGYTLRSPYLALLWGEILKCLSREIMRSWFRSFSWITGHWLLNSIFSFWYVISIWVRYGLFETIVTASGWDIVVLFQARNKLTQRNSIFFSI